MGVFDLSNIYILGLPTNIIQNNIFLMMVSNSIICKHMLFRKIKKRPYSHLFTSSFLFDDQCSSFMYSYAQLLSINGAYPIWCLIIQ